MDVRPKRRAKRCRARPSRGSRVGKDKSRRAADDVQGASASSAGLSGCGLGCWQAVWLRRVRYSNLQR